MKISTVKLGSICTFQSGGTPSKSIPEYWEGNIPWITTVALNGGYINEKDTGERITETALAKSAAKLVPAQSLMVGTRVGVGKVAINTVPMSTSQDVVSLIGIDEEKWYKPYLSRFLQGKSHDLQSQSRGATIKGIKIETLSELKVPLISLEKQIRISKLLETVETLIFTRKQQLTELDTLVKARFVEMFGSLDDNEKKLVVVTINDVCSLIKDGTHQTPTYTEDRQNGFKFLSAKDVMTQKISWGDIKYIPADLHEKLYATIQPRRNDILMSKNGVNYGVAAVNDTDEVFDIYVSLALLRPKVDKVNPVYFRCAINNYDTKRQFDSSIKGIGVPNLHLGEIKKTRILLPPLSQQNEFVAFIEQVDKSKLLVQRQIAELEMLKESLMQKYFG